MIKKALSINGLIYAMCFSVIGFVGMNFVTCNFYVPGSIHARWVSGQLKNDPNIDCVKSQNEGLIQLLGAAGLLFAFKAKSEE